MRRHLRTDRRAHYVLSPSQHATSCSDELFERLITELLGEVAA